MPESPKVGSEDGAAGNGSPPGAPAPGAPPTQPTAETEVAPPEGPPPAGTEGAAPPGETEGAAPPAARESAAPPAAGAPAERDVNARLDGLRGWLAQLDRIVAIRTRVGLVLLALGVGAAAAAMYLAIDTRDDSASEDELRQLRSDVERAVEASASRATDDSAAIQRLEAEVRRLRRAAAAEGAAPRGGASAGAGAAAGAGTPSAGQAGGGPASP